MIGRRRKSRERRGRYNSNKEVQGEEWGWDQKGKRRRRSKEAYTISGQ